MKRIVILLMVLLALVGLYFGVIHEKGGSTLDQEDAMFAVEDTGAVTRIALYEYKEGASTRSIVLDRTEGGWQVNGQYPAFLPRVKKFIETLHLIRVRASLNEEAQANVNKFLEIDHTLVEVFAGDERIKSYLVGSATKDRKGTFMCMRDSDVPFIVDLPGLPGYVKTRYQMGLGSWRENLLFRASKETLEKLEITYTTNPEQSWSITKEEADWNLSASNENFDADKWGRYLEKFNGRVYGESFADASYPGKLDSLMERPADIIFHLKVSELAPQT
ncbi:MAG: DUF4340 domain-containing protein, partial [Bacteroidota bacterium]